MDGGREGEGGRREGGGLLSQRRAALLVSDLEQTSHGWEFEWQTGTNWCPLFFGFDLSLSLS